MKNLIRYDEVLGATVSRTDEGYLLVSGVAAVPGILVYRNADGTERRELVRADELSSSLDSLKMKPVTLSHPSDMIGPNTIKGLSVGTVGSVETREDGSVGVSFTIADAGAIKAAESGIQALSPGYRVNLDMTPGVDPVFGAYDAVQTGRRYNHLAIVQRARGGEGVGFRLDSDDNLIQEGDMKINEIIEAIRKDVASESLVKELIKAGLSKEEASKMAEAIASKASKNTKKEAAAEGESEKKEAKENMDSKKKEKPASTDWKKDHAEELLDWHNERKRLDTLADRYSIKLDGLDNHESSVAILKAAGVTARLDSADYVAARIDALSEVPVLDKSKQFARSDKSEEPKKPVSHLARYGAQFNR